MCLTGVREGEYYLQGLSLAADFSNLNQPTMPSLARKSGGALRPFPAVSPRNWGKRVSECGAADV